MMFSQRSNAMCRTTAIAAIGAMMWAGSPALAQDEDPGPNTGKVSLSAGVDFTNGYYFRGLLQEDSGLIVQQWADITLNLAEGLDFTVGIWDSFHTEQTGASGTGPEIWYEADIYLGLTASMVKDWEMGITYTAYTSPNDAFSTVEEIALSAAYDDSWFWDGSDLFNGLAPSVVIAFETDQSVDGNDEGIYLGIGIEPSVNLMAGSDYPLTLSMPVTLGFSLDNYYESPVDGNDNFFGFFDVGVVASLPLTCVPADYGQWEVHAGVHILTLQGGNAEDFNDGDNPDVEYIGNIGISMSY